MHTLLLSYEELNGVRFRGQVLSKISLGYNNTKKLNCIYNITKKVNKFISAQREDDLRADTRY